MLRDVPQHNTAVFHRCLSFGFSAKSLRCIAFEEEHWMYTKKVDKYDKIEDKQRRQKNVRKEKQ